MPFYYAIVPVAATNLVSNPSAERDATGWAGTVSANTNRQAGTAVFGGWAMGGTPAAGANSGITGGTVQIAAAGSFTVSAYVYGPAGSVYSIGMKGTGAGAAFVGSVAGTTGGTWHRYSFSYGEAAASQRLFAVVKRSAGVDPFFVDGVQVESGTFQTTYIDGQQEGCVWNGAPHASTSQRSGTSRQGGTVISLQSLGMTVLEHGGVGMPSVDNITQEYAIADGAIWQRQRATSRVFTLTSLFSGTTWAGLHAIRSGIIDLLKIDRTPNPQPTRLLYTGAGGTSVIDAYYDGGMSMETRAGFSETTAVRLMAPDPYWYASTDEGTQLTSQVNLGSVNYIAQRSGIGQWGTMGANGSSIQNALDGVRAVRWDPRGTLFVGGEFGTAGGTRAPHVAMWNPTTSAWGTLGPGTIQLTLTLGVRALELDTTGTLYIGGEFVSVAGTSAVGLVYWNGAAWGTLPPGGGVSGDVYAIKYALGSLFVSGDISGAGGTSVGNVAYWNANAWGTLTASGVNNDARGLAVGYDNAVYVTGNLNSAGGTTAEHVARWNGAWGTMGLGIQDVSGALGWAAAAGVNGAIYIAGAFGTAGGMRAQNIAQWNGNQWQPLGAGLNNASYGLKPTPVGGLYAAGDFTASGSISIPDGIAFWNGAAWLPLDIDLPSVLPFTGRAVELAADGRLWVGGAFSGTATAAVVTTIVNDGAANTYPVAVFRNTSASVQRLYQILNTATGDGIWFNLNALPGETLTLDLRNGAKTLASDFRGNLLGAILPGSNLTTWKLAPGTNYISVFAASGSVETTIYWRNRAWSADPRL